MAELSEIDKKIVRVLQGDFPLVADPYAELAKQVGISKEEFLERAQAMKQEHLYRKMGAVLAHRKAGFKSNVLVAWQVPEERVEAVCKKMSEHPRVSHCYDRNTAPGWQYNVYTMVHGHSREECEQIVAELAKQTGIEKRAMLYTVKEWKKTSMKYFNEDKQ